MKKRQTVLLLLLVGLFSGCMSIKQTFRSNDNQPPYSYESKFYAGVRADANGVVASCYFTGCLLAPISLIDMPFSFVADTIFLPYTIYSDARAAKALDAYKQGEKQNAGVRTAEYEDLLAKAKTAHVDPWVYALEMPGTSGLKTLIEGKYDFRARTSEDVIGNRIVFRTVLHEAIRRKKFDDLQFLLDNGADPNVRTSNYDSSQSPLIFAISEDSVESVRILVKHWVNTYDTWLGVKPKDWVGVCNCSKSDKAVMWELISQK